MRMSHFEALADILLGDGATLARSYHEIANGTFADFETEDARRRCAIAVQAVGMAVDPVGYTAACARIAGEPKPPLASTTGEIQ